MLTQVQAVSDWTGPTGGEGIPGEEKEVEWGEWEGGTI